MSRLRHLNWVAIVLVVALVGVAGTTAYLARNPKVEVVEDSPLLVPVRNVTPRNETSTSAVGATPARPAAPVQPPKDHYAAEPIQPIGTIEIPKIGLVHQVYHGITLRNIDRGPSHWPGTPFPGETGNSVFAGHRVTHSHPFRNIHQLVAGDEVHFTINGHRTTYLVTGSEIVTPKALHITDPTPHASLTLFACHPPGSARQRYVVRANLA